MKRILIVASDGITKSGVPNVFMNIMRHMHNMGYVFDVLYFDETLPFFKEEIVSLGGKLIFSNLDKRKTNKIQKLLIKRQTSKIIEKIIKENGPYDCVHSFKGLDSGYVLRAAYKCGVPSRVSHMAFTFFPSKNPFIRFIENHERKLIDKYSIYVVSDSEKTAINNIPYSKKNIVIQNFYDETFTYNDVREKTNEISFIQIGSYSFNKNQLFSINILKDILKQYPNSILHFVGFKNSGDPTYFDKLCSYVKENNLSDHIVFHKHDENTKELFTKCHYLLFPSLSESFGIVPVEAQASGLSCFCSDTVTRENNCGGCTYLPLKEPQKWIEAIINDFEATKGAHKKFNLTNFSAKEIVKKYELVYENKYQK